MPPSLSSSADDAASAPWDEERHLAYIRRLRAGEQGSDKEFDLAEAWTKRPREQTTAAPMPSSAPPPKLRFSVERTEDGYQLGCPAAGRDYHLRLEDCPKADPEDGEWMLDEFDSRQPDAHRAYLGTTTHPDVADALATAFERAEVVVHGAPPPLPEPFAAAGEALEPEDESMGLAF